MTFEVSSFTKFQIFRNSTPDLAGGAYSAPPDPLASGEGLAAPPQEPPPRPRPFGPRASAFAPPCDSHTLMLIPG